MYGNMGFDLLGLIAYPASMRSVKINGLTQVCCHEKRFHRRSSRLILLRFETRGTFSLELRCVRVSQMGLVAQRGLSYR